MGDDISITLDKLGEALVDGITTPDFTNSSLEEIAAQAALWKAFADMVLELVGDEWA